MLRANGQGGSSTIVLATHFAKRKAKSGNNKKTTLFVKSFIFFLLFKQFRRRHAEGFGYFF
jgi:hypothetical protein